jgi:DNA-binding NarL/FixJ family response regulator
MTIKIIIADDHTIVREGLKSLIDSMGRDIEIIGEASNGNEVLEMAEKTPADVYVLDISMPILNGIEATDRLIRMNPNNKIIMLSRHDNKELVKKALNFGARGYILKSNTGEELVNAIKEVSKGKTFLSPKISAFMVDKFLGKKHQYEKKKKSVDLTRREREILQLIAEGFSNKEIAEKLNISFSTVHVHRSNIMEKLNIHKQAGLIRYAINEGISGL